MPAGSLLVPVLVDGVSRVTGTLEHEKDGNEDNTDAKTQCSDVSGRVPIVRTA
jgi:hypothetical protein